MQALFSRTLFVFIILAGSLAACQKNQQTPRTGAAESTPAEVVATEGAPEAPVTFQESVPPETGVRGPTAGSAAATGAEAPVSVPGKRLAMPPQRESMNTRRSARVTREANGRPDLPAGEAIAAAAPPAAAPSREALRQDYLNKLRTASYTFNPPSPIKVDVPRTVHLWVDTIISPEELGAMLRQIVPPDDRAGIVTGQVRVAPEMEARLTGEKFEIRPTSPERQSVNLEGRTIWGWEITPTWPGQHTLHLRLVAILPEAIGSSYTIPALLDRTIEVEVTLWWLFDHFFDKYWQWLLGGLGTMLAAFAWWWKKRATAG